MPELPDLDLDDVEVHPRYDVTTHLDALYSVPLYRHPAHAAMERWRELGERLLAAGEPALAEAAQLAEQILQARLAARGRRAARRRRARSPRAPSRGGSP